MVSLRLGRRQAVATAAALPFTFIHTGRAAGRLSIAFMSSLVPGCDQSVQRLVESWGEKNNIAVRADFLSAVTSQSLVVPQAEAQARAGHDIIHFLDYNVVGYIDQLEPVDDVVARLVAIYGPPFPETEYFAKPAAAWRAVPTGMGSLYLPSESRIDSFRDHAGLDVPATFPPGPEMGPHYDQWDWTRFLMAAEKCFKAGVPFGLPISNCADANAWINALFLSFDARLVDASGNVTVRSEGVREALDYIKRLAQFLPPDVYAWTSASNNRALISGKSALIFNPPSAWASAVKTNPTIGEQIWHHPLPGGKYGRFLPWGPTFLGIWNFSRNKTAAKELITWLGERAQVEATLVTSQGYDVPPFASLNDFPIWAEAEPPKGTLYN
ncbi:MAG: ABC transporter substrate-binding protein, partial [Acetobacteraceae bacterium]